jgi:hypothetical protein
MSAAAGTGQGMLSHDGDDVTGGPGPAHLGGSANACIADRVRALQFPWPVALSFHGGRQGPGRGNRTARICRIGIACVRSGGSKERLLAVINVTKRRSVRTFQTPEGTYSSAANRVFGRTP